MVIELRLVQFWSEIILVISNRTHAARSFDFEITRMISDQIALHLVQLPLLIAISANFVKSPLSKEALAISFEFLLKIWRFWRLIAISAIFGTIPTFKWALCHLIWIFVYNLAILAINRHSFHFRQNCHFQKGPLAMLFDFLFTIWRFWRLIAIPSIFTKYAIFPKITTFKRKTSWTSRYE